MLCRQQAGSAVRLDVWRCGLDCVGLCLLKCARAVHRASGNNPLLWSLGLRFDRTPIRKFEFNTFFKTKRA